mgnify:CR=1 FL=1
MRLTTYSDFALRTLMFAAARHPQLTSIAEVAQSYGIPQGHVRKIVHELSRAGLLLSVRGRLGGFRLARSPAELRLDDIVRQTETDFALAECFAPRAGGCRLQPGCRLQHALATACDAFLDSLAGWTLADLVEPRSAFLAAFASGGATRPPTAQRAANRSMA